MQDSEERIYHCPVLETERLTLRRPGAADAGAIVRIVGDWDVARRLARIPHPYSNTDALWFLDNIVPGEWVWAITWRESAEVVGMVGLTPHDRDAAELGYYVDRRHWGHGIATEAARAVVEYGFRGLGLRFLTSGYFLDNPVSGGVLTKLGFVEVARGERPCLAAGALVPCVEMRLGPGEISAAAEVPAR